MLVMGAESCGCIGTVQRLALYSQVFSHCVRNVPYQNYMQSKQLLLSSHTIILSVTGKAGRCYDM